MKTIGIVGGMGPAATVRLMELIVNMTDADTDQEHPRVVMDSIPMIPDRTAYIVGKSRENPAPLMEKAVGNLEKIGAEVIAIPCITAYYFYRDFMDRFDVDIISLPERVASYAKKRDVKTAGILATEGSIKTGILVDEFNKKGIDTILPDADISRKLSYIIYDNIKKSESPDLKVLGDIVSYMKKKGAESLVLGCTELPLMKKYLRVFEQTGNVDMTLIEAICDRSIDVLEVLAYESLRRADVPVRPGFAFL